MGTPGDKIKIEDLVDEPGPDEGPNDDLNRSQQPPPSQPLQYPTAATMTIPPLLPDLAPLLDLYSVANNPPYQLDKALLAQVYSDPLYQTLKSSDTFLGDAADEPGPSGLQTPKTKTKASMKRLKKQTQKKLYACPVCQKTFPNAVKLSKHQVIHGSSSPYKCEHCKKVFSSKFKLVRHVLIHSDRKPFSCSVCERTFHRKDHLKNHIKVHNPSKKLHVCDKSDCRKEYTSLLSFKKHLALHAAEEGILDCQICRKSFRTKEEVLYHLKIHAGSRTVKNPDEKKFKCDFCERKFFTRKDIRRHMVVHTGKRDFLCQFCPQRFGRKDHLVRHIKKSHPKNAPLASLLPGSSSAAAGSSSTTTTTTTLTAEVYIKSETEESNLSEAAVPDDDDDDSSTTTSFTLDDALLVDDVMLEHAVASQGELTDLGSRVLEEVVVETSPAATPSPAEAMFADAPFENLLETMPLPAFNQIFHTPPPKPPPPS